MRRIEWRNLGAAGTVMCVLLGLVACDLSDPAGPNLPSTAAFSHIPFTLGSESKLLATDAASNDFFGFHVAISGDRAIVGAYQDDDAGSASGSAYIYFWDGISWTEETKLTASDAAAGDRFGHSVDIDGDRAIVGAVFDDDAGSASGSAYVFRLTGGGWVEEAKLVASDASGNAQFGAAVSIEGEAAIVGSVGPGAYVFRRTDTTWNEEAKLNASDQGPSDTFGRSVSIDGDVAIVGSANHTHSVNQGGAAYVFRRSGGGWVEDAEILSSDIAAFDGFGVSVAVSGDVVVVGADADDDDGSESGSAYVFRYDGLDWTEEAKLTASDADAVDQFGGSVSVDGDLAVVGAELSGPGGAYVFRSTDSGWAEDLKLTSTDGSNGDRFGAAVGSSGERVVAGGSGNDDNGLSSGSAYVYQLLGGHDDPPEDPPEEENSPPEADAGPDQELQCVAGGTSVTLDGTGSSDPDGDDLSYAWTDDQGNEIATGPSPTIPLGLGVHVLTLTVSDGGESDADEVVVTVVDTVPPEISLRILASQLWSPSHEMRPVVRDISVEDACDEDPRLTVLVASNEPVKGKGSGNTAPDWEVVENGDGTFDVWVRAERSGTGSGRVYTITATATDASGNSAETTVRVTVPKSRGRR